MPAPGSDFVLIETVTESLAALCKKLTVKVPAVVLSDKAVVAVPVWVAVTAQLSPVA